jgi:hypothetical protein
LPERPWTDEDLLRELYWGEMMSPREIADVFDCAYATVFNWLDKHGIRKRNMSEATMASHGTYWSATFYTDNEGYEMWTSDSRIVRVHRLQAVAEWGLDAVGHGEVHHKNGIPWDNRVENLEVYDTHGEHMQQHRKFSDPVRLIVADLYENRDVSSRELADDLGFISPNTIRAIHREVFGGDEAHA